MRFLVQPNLQDVANAMNEASQYSTFHCRLWVAPFGVNLSSKEVMIIAENGKKLFPEKGKVALVGQDDLTFGLGRMYDAHRNETDTETQVFRTELEAMGWLRL